MVWTEKFPFLPAQTSYEYIQELASPMKLSLTTLYLSQYYILCNSGSTLAQP